MNSALSAPGTIQPIAELFTGSVTAFWATTYSLQLELLNEFLLPRLGDPPLNVVVLVDQARLAAALDRVPEDRVNALSSVNRKWLLRGVTAGGYAFHPKSYLAASARRAKLLVGSGNLGMDGFEEGKEVFTIFHSGTPVGDAAIRIWLAWMRPIVERAGDTTLAQRFRRLADQVNPFIGGPLLPGVPPLVHNLERPLAVQLVEVASSKGSGVDEIHFAAPFYDSDAAAVAFLLSQLRPSRVYAYTSDLTSLPGQKLLALLEDSQAAIEFYGYQPDTFIHAKLVAVVNGGDAWLMSGSPNLSGRALLSTATHGNTELAVLAQIDPSTVQGHFLPPGMSLISSSREKMSGLEFKPSAEGPSREVVLLSARAGPDGRVTVKTTPPPSEDWLLDDLTVQLPLSLLEFGTAVTVAPLPGRLVRLMSKQGTVLSNRVVVDDPPELEAVLLARSGEVTNDRPTELTEADLQSPLGMALAWLHRNLVMDVTERLASLATGGVGTSEAEEQSEDNLWERLEREQLLRDPRSQTYSRIWAALPGEEPIIELLAVLGARVSSRRVLPGMVFPSRDAPEGQTEEEEGKESKHAWTLASRIRVRARNVLARWAAAQHDSRLVWVDPLAPAANFSMVCGFFAHLRLLASRDASAIELTIEDLDELWFKWMRAFAGTGRADGWLDTLHPTETPLARERMPSWVPETAAALCYLALRPRVGHRERVIEWQPVISAGLTHKLLEPTDEVAAWVSDAVGQPVSRPQVDDVLLSAVEFIDDELWSERTAAQFDLKALSLQAGDHGADVQVRLEIRGIEDPVLDPRLPCLVVAARRYRRSGGVAVHSLDWGWRLAFVDGQPISYLPALGRRSLNSASELANGMLEQLAATGGVLGGGMFPNSAQVA